MKTASGWLLLALLIPASAQAYRIERISGPGTSAIGGKTIEVAAEETMVKFSTRTASDHAAVLARIGASVVQEFPGIGWTHVALASGTPVVSGMNQLRALPEIIQVQPNHVYRPSRVPSDPLVPSQPNLSQINAFGGWEYETGASNAVTIAIVDSGIDGSHTDLNAKIINLGANARSMDCTANPCVADNGHGAGIPSGNCSHGTQTAGVAAASANNGVGIAGISWGANLVSIKIFSCAGGTETSSCNGGCAGEFQNSASATDAVIIRAINYVIGMNGVAGVGRIVMNMSFGSAGQACTAGDTSAAVGALQAALQNAAGTGQGIVMAAATGNTPSGGSVVDQPANCAPTVAGLIPVGSVDANNGVSFFSNRGSELACCGVVAPGENIETTQAGGGFTSNSGTSFSAPTVAGLAALILSAKPTATSDEVRSIIRAGADKIGISSLGAAGPSLSAQPSGNLSGAGRIDMFRSMRLAVKGTLADFAGDQKAIAVPNPFRPGTQGSVMITIPTALQSSNATIRIYTVDAKLVRTLTGLSWDGKNESGNPVVSGTYVFEVKTDAGKTTGRLAVIR